MEIQQYRVSDFVDELGVLGFELSAQSGGYIPEDVRSGVVSRLATDRLLVDLGVDRQIPVLETDLFLVALKRVEKHYDYQFFG